MIVKNQLVTMRWNNKHKKYYESLGYIYTGRDEEFKVKIDDLKNGSSVLVLYNCDYCGNEYKIPFKKIKDDIKYACPRCVPLKRKETNLKKYGVENAMQNDLIKKQVQQTNLKKYGCLNPMQNTRIQQKVKETNLKKYNVEYSLQSEIVRNKIKQTNLEKYGVEYSFQAEEVKNKIKQTNLERYGVEYSFQSEEVKNKIKSTFIKRYGVDHYMKNKEAYEKYKLSILNKYNVDNVSKLNDVKFKIRQSLYMNENAPSSKNQRYLCNLLNGRLNYPINSFSLDIAFPDINIYVEYDGSGHSLQVQRGYITEQQFIKKEVFRKKYLQEKGWKIIRIISKHDKMYNDDLIVKLYNKAKKYLLNTNHTWVEIDIDNNEYKCSQFIENII